MILNFNKRLLSALICTLALIFLGINYSFYHAALSSNLHKYSSPTESSISKPVVRPEDRRIDNKETPGYDVDDVKEGNDWCSRVAGTRYLDDLASTWTVSCSNPGLNPVIATTTTTTTGGGGDGGTGGTSKDGGMICFQSQIEEEPDNFCVAKNVVYISDVERIKATPLSKEDLFRLPGVLPPGTARDTGGGEKRNTRPSRSYRRDRASSRAEQQQQQREHYNSHTRRQYSPYPWELPPKQWLLNCSANQNWMYGVQAPYRFRTYFSETGVGRQLRNFDMSIKEADVEKAAAEEEEGKKKCSGSIMLVKLEGGGNIWHTLMEVWSAVLTLDALKKAQKARERLFGISSGTNDEEKIWEEGNIQIYIQENMESEMNASPVFGLWNVVTGKKVKDAKELKDGCYKSVILPLAGGANPFWKDHWKERKCEKSALVDGFVEKVLKFYGVDDDTHTPAAAVVDSEKIKIRIIGRQKNRKILRLFDYVKNLQKVYPNADIEITKLEKLDVTEQLRMIRKTDILIGVTGAGLTHTMFLREGAAVIELTQPEPFVYFGFGNLARMIGLGYFPIHAEKREGKSGINWQEDNVLVDEQTLVDAVGRAIEGVKASKKPRAVGRSNDIN
ncbi:hypothetical protein TWF506_005250 [Arthrobotrys conoides]|uniref:EGF domain-specific O-linked N-acetylglucosamine transferase n=1 Tax=Arthrobotrys conoides TaxID=74498 RepID=A0AAN8NDV4_9PEZI